MARDLAEVPHFTLSDENQQPVKLSDLVADGQAVIVFYRGHW